MDPSALSSGDRLAAGVERVELTPLRLLAVVAGLVAVSAVVQDLTGRQLGDVAQVVAASGAAVACALAARRQAGPAKVAWSLLTAGALVWCAGRLGWSVQGLARESRQGTATSADVGALFTAMSFILGALLLVERPRRRLTRIRFLVEGLMIGGCTLFVSWVLVFRATFEASAEAGVLARTVLLSQPLLQVAIIAVILAVSTRVPADRVRWWVPLALGIAAVVVSDAAFAHAASIPGFAGTRIDDVGRIAGFAAVVLAASRARVPVPLAEARPRRRRTTRILTSVPSLCAMGVMAGAAIHRVGGQALDPALVWIALGLLGLSVLLHLVVILESEQLSADLSQAHDEAIQASITKSHFLATVSHEIRTPMNAVIGLTGLLLDSELDDEQRELAMGVAISAEGLLDLINDLLDFSKIEADKLELEDIDLDLEHLVDEVGMIVAENAHRKGLEVIAYCEPGLVTQRRGDPLRLRQILLNLASNAVKFTNEGTVVVRAMAGSGPEDVAFEVTDTGVGIPEAERGRLFEPFSQLDGSTTRTFGGTGLGLAIVKRLTDLLGGEITVDSEESVGTSFTVTCPLSLGVQPDVEARLSDLEGLRALVVDGNAVTRTVLAYTLHTWGFVVDQAESAEDALELYTWTNGPRRTYAVALIEHQLDGMDGVQLAEALRAQEPTATTAIFLLTAAHTVSRQAAHDAGIQSVLVKPVRNTYLLRRLVDSLVTADQPGVLVDAGRPKGTP